jgi:hypothetical protein
VPGIEWLIKSIPGEGPNEPEASPLLGKKITDFPVE